jgi:hypothetical protein
LLNFAAVRAADTAGDSGALEKLFWDAPQLQTLIDKSWTPVPCADNEVFEVPHVPHVAMASFRTDIWFHHSPYLCQSYTKEANNKVLRNNPVCNKNAVSALMKFPSSEGLSLT